MVLQIGGAQVLQKIGHFSANWDEISAFQRSFAVIYPCSWANGFAEKLHEK
jgi:hypothetical protein